MNEKNTLSVIIPVYNEGKTILRFLENLAHALSAVGISHELIIVDDCSTDDSKSIILNFLKDAKFPKTFLRNEKNYGRGYSLSRGFACAKNSKLIYFDADILVKVALIRNMLDNLDRYDLVICSKHQKGSKIDSGRLRILLSNCYSFFARRMISSEILDFQCGIKGIRRDRYRQIEGMMSQKRWSWDTELLMYASLKGYKIKEIPLHLSFIKRDSKVVILRDSYFMGINLVKLWIDKASYCNARQFFNRKSAGYSGRRYRGLQSLFRGEKDSLLKAVNPGKHDKILDVGCGDGYYTMLFREKGAEVEGIDFSEKMSLELARKGVVCHTADMNNFELGKKFDKIVISGAAEFSHNFQAALQNLHRHLNKDGEISILFPRKSAFSSLYWLYHLTHGIVVKLHSEAEIRSLLNETGYNKINIRKVNALSSIASAEK